MIKEDLSKSTPMQVHKNIEEILVTVRTANDGFMTLSSQIDLILLNLELEGARLSTQDKPNAVGVIAHELRKNILEAREKMIKTLQRRQELKDSMVINKENIEKYEALLKLSDNTQK